MARAVCVAVVHGGPGDGSRLTRTSVWNEQEKVGEGLSGEHSCWGTENGLNLTKNQPKVHLFYKHQDNNTKEQICVLVSQLNVSQISSITSKNRGNETLEETNFPK